MEIRFGAISCDSHVCHGPDDFTARMSASKWGDKIPHTVEIERDGRLIELWGAYGRMGRGSERDLCNCIAVMEPRRYPMRWEEVPMMAYDPQERLKALDIDRVDGEVLFPNTGAPGGAFFQYGDPDFELDVVRAYNDTLADWVRVSDRYIALAILPLLQEPAGIVREIERAVDNGHRGVCVGGTPRGVPPLLDPHWDPIWEVCQQLGVAAHFHSGGGFGLGWGSTAAGAGAGPNLGSKATAPGGWDGYTVRQDHMVFTSPFGTGPAKIIPHLIFSGLTERFPSLKFVFAENGVGSFMYAKAACDYEWENRQLWKEGITTRPSEVVSRQMYAGFWFEAGGMKMRHELGMDNLMWESDLPHVTSYWPRSWEAVEHVLEGVPSEERPKLMYGNALRVYGISGQRSGDGEKSSAVNGPDR